MEITDDLITIDKALEEMLTVLSQSTQKTRERSLVLTKLQEARMWAREGLHAEREVPSGSTSAQSPR